MTTVKSFIVQAPGFFKIPVLSWLKPTQTHQISRVPSSNTIMNKAYIFKPEAGIIKLFTAVINSVTWQDKGLVTFSQFYLGAKLDYPSGAPRGNPLRVGSRPFGQI